MKSTVLFFLLFALCTQHLTLAEELVLDFYGHPLNDSYKYHILLASNTAQGIQDEELGSDTCPVSVVMGIDPKEVTFYPVEPPFIGRQFHIDDPLYIKFVSVSPCATSHNWTVKVAGESQYPVVVGPPVNTTTMPGTFRIKKAEDHSTAYNIAFAFIGKDEHLLYTIPSDDDEDLLLVNLCGDEGTNVVFSPISPAPPSPSPPPPPPPPTSTFKPLIRKIVA